MDRNGFFESPPFLFLRLHDGCGSRIMDRKQTWPNKTISPPRIPFRRVNYFQQALNISIWGHYFAWFSTLCELCEIADASLTTWLSPPCANGPDAAGPPESVLPYWVRKGKWCDIGGSFRSSSTRNFLT